MVSSQQKIGIILDNFGPNQAAFFAIKTVNDAYYNSEHEYTLFYNNLTRPCVKPGCAIMSMCETYSFDGILIATNISQANTIAKQPIHKTKKFLYLQDLEWLRPSATNRLLFNLSTLRDDSINIICRSESHGRTLFNYCNKKPIGYIDDFNREQLEEVVFNG